MNTYNLIPCDVEAWRWDTSHWKRLTHTRMENPMAAALVSGSFEPVRVACQGNNLAKETR